MQTVVVKIGGSLAGQHLNIVSQLIETLHRDGKAVVLVHGGGPRISKTLEAQGLEMPWHEGQRVTSQAAAQVVQQVLCGEVNNELVSALKSHGANALGMCGADNVIAGAPLPGLQQTADVASVATEVLHQAVGEGQVPVLAPVGRDAHGQFCNINADLAAASVAGALQAERIIFLTDVEGIYYDWENKLRLTDCSIAEMEDWFQKGAFTAGMIPKVRAVLRAVKGSVSSAFVVHGSQEKTVLAAGHHSLQTPWDETYGTRIMQLQEARIDESSVNAK